MALAELISRTLDQPVPAEIRAVAAHIASGRPGVAAILAYGSCLRGVATSDSLIDLYVLTDDLAGVSGNLVSCLACRAVPPNVYYSECDIAGERYRAKFAVLPLSLFASWMTADNPYFWARFSQPSALLHAASAEARQQVIAAVETAITTMYRNARGVSAASDPADVWAAGFAETYQTELRPESASRGSMIAAAQADYYREAAALLGDLPPLPANWPARRFRGKLWSVVRLIKASFTFAGGADYMVWKIERHSGHRIELTDGQASHPIYTGLRLLPRMLKRGAVR